MGMDKVTLHAHHRSPVCAGQLLHGLWRAHRHRHAAAGLVRHRGAEAALPAQAGLGRVDRRLRAFRGQLRLRRHEHPHPRHALSRRQPLHAQRRKEVDHQLRHRRACTPSSPRSDRRTKVLRVPDRARHAGADRGRGRAQAGHSRLVHLSAGACGLQDSRGQSAGRGRQGPPHRLQRAERGPLQAGRGLHRRRAPCAGAHDPLRQGAARPSARRSPSSA